MSNFAANLRAARLKAELTQVQAARRAKIAQSSWCEYERGMKAPSMDQAERLAKAVGRGLRELI